MAYFWNLDNNMYLYLPIGSLSGVKISPMDWINEDGMEVIPLLSPSTKFLMISHSSYMFIS
jgi:hypothetical protein